MTSLLTPAYTLTLGSQRWTEQLLSLDLTLAIAPLLDVLVVRLPIAAPFAAAPGDQVSLTLDNGEAAADVFAGRIRSIERGFETIRITALDAGGDLARFRPATTFQQLSAGTVVRNLCDAVGVATGDIEDGVDLAYYAADPSRTAWDHVSRVAAWSGALATVGSDNTLNFSVLDATRSELALRYGRELLAFDQQRRDDPVARHIVAGESGAGETAVPEARRPVTDFFAGNRPDGPTAANRWRWEPALRTVAAAGTAGAALDRRYRSSRERGRFDAFLQPKLRPGTVFEIQDLPDGLAVGPHWAYRVRHRLDPAGARTEAHFYKGGDSFDLMALLGSLAGALGGLL